VSEPTEQDRLKATDLIAEHGTGDPDFFGDLTAAIAAALAEERAKVAPSDAPRTATAAEQPCQLYAHTGSPVPLRTQYHHSKPVYLQNRLYGRIVHPADMWLCGLCHDAVHEVIDWLLGEGRQPNPAPGRKTLAEAQRTVEWYLAEKEPHA
jgi:hypothetical protein